MPSPIFLIDQDNRLQKLESTPYETEALLQRLLAEHSDVLGAAGDESAKLLLINREYGVPGEEGGSAVWSLDHLFIDRNAVPVLVEVKRATDTRIRREVVAQMLDYAANGVLYWPIAQIIEAFEKECAEHNANPTERLAEFLGEEAEDAESFWKQVEANLRSGRIRLVFVADSIPKELRTIVVFLNEQMRQAEVLAIEIQQYVSATGLRTLVPQTVGATERARVAKAAKSDKPPISLDEWLGRMEDTHGHDARKAADKIIAWMRSKGAEVGPTDSHDAVYFKFDGDDGKPAWPFYIRAGQFQISLQYLKNRPRLSDDNARRNFVERFKEIPGLILSTDNIGGWPSTDLPALLDEATFERYTQVANDLIAEAVKAA